MEMKAYFDHGSTSPLRRCAYEAMQPWLKEGYGNASSPYSLGRESRAAVDSARDLISFSLGVNSREIIFTGCGTESLVLTLIGAYIGNRHKGNHVITTTFEHHATHAIFEFLRDEMGAEFEMVNVDENGLVKLDELESMLKDDTVLVSIMGVNNEVGTVQDLYAISDMCRKRGIILHSDFVQTIGKHSFDLTKGAIDLACASAHKFGGPKGVGFFYIREGVYVKNYCEGSHEFGLRSGTENVAGIVGMASATEAAIRDLPDALEAASGFRDQIWDCINSTAPGASFNGDQNHAVPMTFNVHLPDCDGEMMVLGLDRAGVATATASACLTGATEPSHVLKAMGVPRKDALSSLRISLGWSSTQDEIDHFKEVFPDVYNRVRNS